VLVALVAFGVYSLRKSSAQGALAVRIAEMGSGGAPPETIEGLRSAIATYENRIEGYIKEAAQAGIYWKILAVRLMDRNMHGEALKALERAVQYFPEDSSLHYLTGLSAGVLAKSDPNFLGLSANLGRERLFARSEAAYLRSIALDDRYVRPLYGLAVLYVFELNKPEAAIPYLLRYLELRTNDADALFILARAYYMAGDYKKAVESYDAIIAATRDSVKKAEAENNKKTVLGEMYE